MLKQRAITALWLLPLMLGMLFYAPQWLRAVSSGLIALTILWEYAYMSGLDEIKTSHYLAATLLLGIVAYAGSQKLPSLVRHAALVFWLTTMPPWLNRKWKLSGGWQTCMAGWMLTVPFQFALVSLRSDFSGALPLLAVMGLVWAVDIFTYFNDKAFGEHKLAPAINPDKSWEGTADRALCMVVYITLMRDARWPPFETGRLATVGVGLILIVISMCGDLLEGQLKRSADIKDNSNLLLGHGRVFDRVDSLIAALSVYVALIHLFQNNSSFFLNLREST